jgi:hypothetical protein
MSRVCSSAAPCAPARSRRSTDDSLTSKPGLASRASETRGRDDVWPCPRMAPTGAWLRWDAPGGRTTRFPSVGHGDNRRACDGVKNARTGLSPYLWTIPTDRNRRSSAVAVVRSCSRSSLRAGRSGARPPRLWPVGLPVRLTPLQMLGTRDRHWEVSKECAWGGRSAWSMPSSVLVFG